MPEQALARAEDLAGAWPGGFAQVAGDMRGAGQQVGQHQQVGLTSAPPSEIVLQIVSVGLGRDGGPVLNPPPGASAGGDFGNIPVRDVEIGDEAIAAGHPAAELGGPDLRPGDAERIGTVEQGRVGPPPVSVETFARTPPACGPMDLLRHRALQVFAQCLVAWLPPVTSTAS